MKYYFPVDDIPVVLSETENLHTKVSEEEKQGTSSTNSLGNDSQFIVVENVFNSSPDPVSEYLKSCQAMHNLIQSSKSGLEYVLGVVSSTDSEGKNCLRRCLIFRHRRRQVLPSEQLMKEICDNTSDIRMFKFVPNQTGTSYERKVFNGESDDTGEDVRSFMIDYRSDINKIPPMFEMKEFSPIWPSLNRTLDLLKKVVYLPTVKNLLDVVAHELPKDFNAEDIRSKMKHSFVVIEGMDGTGKTTLTKTLEYKLNATRIFQPPQCIQSLRDSFDDLPEIIRRAYYAVGNYITAVCIARECQNRPVIADRFWYSTAVNAIANETTTHDLLPEGHDLYTWPPDLVRPDLVLFLEVSEDVRKQRIRQRREATTDDERYLEENTSQRTRLREAYRRMRDPRCVDVDANGSKEDVAERVIAVMAEQGFH